MTERIPQFVRFIAIGLLNTVFGYLMFVFGLWIGFNYIVANLVALLLGMLFSFLTQGRFVFERLDARRFPRYLVVWCVLWVLNTGLIGWFMPFLDQNAYVAGAAALAVTVPLSFLAQRRWVFR